MSTLWLVPAVPFAGFLILTIGARIPRRIAGVIGTTTAGISMLAALYASAVFVFSRPAGDSYSLTLWQWIGIGNLSSGVTLTLDALSVVMILVVTVVGFLIHLYSVDHMAGQEGYPRFFAYMNLFVGSMLILVLADNLLLLYLGWEGVGLCSYLLIGFWYRDPANGRAARKAFIVTRVGDLALLVGVFLIATNLGTLGLQESARRALSAWPKGSGMAVAAAALILGGAVGKSAQLPLQTWLPDAMAGPSPVSALIHAATMVTAGLYLVARTHVIFSLAPVVQTAVAVIGAATLLIAGTSAVTQRDIKKVLAYSTISQIGYMFLGLGVAAWADSIFHLVSHAFFKSLLFLSAGVIINALDEEHDIFKMGGLARRMPFTFWVFLIGALGLTGIPPVTSGFASKDSIIALAWSSPGNGPALWAVALAGVFVTSLYTFRVLFITFLGEPREAHPGHSGAGTETGRRVGGVIGLPLAILAFLCVVGGLLNFPRILGGRPFLSDFLHLTLPVSPEQALSTEGILQAVSLGASLLGIPFAWFLSKRNLRKTGAAERPAALSRFLTSGWGFDRAYELLLLRPFSWVTRVNGRDVINTLSEGIGAGAILLSRLFRGTQTGRIRWYAVGLAVGGLLIVAAAVIL